MSDITVIYKDGKQETFEDKGAPGGSYSNSVKYEGGFAIIKDAYGKVTSIPAERIARVIHETARRGF